MENFAILLFLPIVTGFILLTIEYKIIQPRNQTQVNSPIKIKSINSAHPNAYQDIPQNKFSPSDAFYALAIGILGGSSGITAAIIMKILANDYYRPNNTDFLNILSELVVNSDFIFGSIVLISLIGGIALAYIVDGNITTMPTFWKRALTSIIFGIVGGFIIFILLIFGAIIFSIYQISKAEK
jgi:hypothetical protein